jgi:hypothetical protein
MVTQLPAIRPDTRFQPGQSGNPLGRPKGGLGLAGYVREHTEDGRLIAAFFIDVMRGRKRGATIRDRLEAAAWLADRGFGKVPQQVAGEGGGPLIVTLKLGDRESQ